MPEPLIESDQGDIREVAIEVAELRRKSEQLAHRADRAQALGIRLALRSAELRERSRKLYERLLRSSLI